MSKELEVQCPCCESTLIIDAESGTVLSHSPKKTKPKSLDEFFKEEKNKSQILDEKFKQGMEKEKNKMSEIQKKFDYAQKNKDKLKDPPPGVQWD